MAKKKKEEVLTLEQLIPKYGEEKAVLDTYKKSTDAVNKQIKELMVEQGLAEKAAGGYVARYSVSKSESYNTEALLNYMHKHKEFEPCIKTQEYVDEQALEDLIYKGKISKTKITALDKFRIVKETPKLIIKKVEA